MRIVERRLSDLSSITYRVVTIDDPTAWRAGILVIAFSGVYRHGSAGADDASFISAITYACVHAWNPKAVVLDLIDLDYQWGDEMDAVLLPDVDPIPVSVAAGPKCAPAIETLLNTRTSDLDWMFATRDEAIENARARSGS